MTRIQVHPRYTLDDGSIMCCDNPLVASDDVCFNCKTIAVWDGPNVHFEREV